jgi:NADH:ubiquinone oxidoreductase subunit 2 (subunit N)
VVEQVSLGLPRHGQSIVLSLAFILLMLGVILRKGLFPAHGWVAPSFAQGSLIPLNLLFNGHLGAFDRAVAIPAFPEIAAAALPALGDLGLLTAGYTAILAISERSPRRLLALLAISRSSFLVAGLESTNADALSPQPSFTWQVVVVATSILTAVYTGLEARLSRPIDGQEFLALGQGSPEDWPSSSHLEGDWHWFGNPASDPGTCSGGSAPPRNA